VEKKKKVTKTEEEKESYNGKDLRNGRFKPGMKLTE